MENNKKINIMPNLIVLILLLSPTYLIRFSIFGIPTTFLEILIYIVFIIGVIKALKAGFRKPSIWFVLPIILLVIALIISTIISPEKRVALGELKGFFIDQIIFLWLIWQFLKKEDLLKLIWSVILSGFFVSCYTIMQKIFGFVTEDGRVVGIFGYSPNYVALFLAPIAVLLASQFLSRFSRRRFLAYLGLSFMLIIFLLAMYFSGSRGGFFAFVGGFGVFLIAHFWPWIKSRISAKIMIIILIVAGIYTSWTLFSPNLNATPDSGRVATSNNVRWQIWQTSWEMIKAKPLLGEGLGNYQSAFRTLTFGRPNFAEYIAPYALTPHNIFLMFWISSGILGLLAFLMLLGVFFREAYVKILKDSTPFVIAFVSTMIIYGLVESSLWKNDLSLLFWSFWGLIWII